VAADSPGSDLPLAIAMGSSGVIAAIATGDSPGTTVATAAAPLLVQAAVALRARWAAKGDRALDVAANHLGVGVDIVLQRSMACADRLELLARVIESSARSTFEERIDALGRVLAEGLHEGGDVGEALVLARALEVLDEPHVVVLISRT